MYSASPYVFNTTIGKIIIILIKALNDLEIPSIELLIGQLENMVEKAGTLLGQEFRDFMCTYNGQFFSPTSNTEIRIFGFSL